MLRVSQASPLQTGETYQARINQQGDDFTPVFALKYLQERTGSILRIPDIDLQSRAYSSNRDHSMQYRLRALLLISCIFYSTAAFPEKLALQNMDWLMSQEKRALLSFITECALRKDQILTTTSQEFTLEYYGKLGLAPSWNGIPNSLTEKEQRWISACVLARVNYFGTPVPFNLRTNKDSGLFTPVTEAEIEEFPYYEGGFFGNLFEQPQKKYVCLGDAPRTVLVGKNRLCTIPGLEGAPATSSCGFTITGSCDDAASFNRDNSVYKEVFHVWLKMH